jgi:hypothetical protein
VLRCSKLAELTLTAGHLPWPWVAFSPDRSSLALPVSPATLAVVGATSLDRETRLDLPGVLSIPAAAPGTDGTTSRQPGLHAVAVHPDGRTVVGLGWHGDLPAACVLRPGLHPELVDLGPTLGDMGPMAATFAAGGESLWISAESHAAAAIARLRFRDFAVEGKVTFSPGPPPASHELFLHPVEDAVLLTMACGQDGTFVRVARVVEGRIALAAGEGDAGLEPCGTAEATEDGTHVCIVAGDSVEMRRWPHLALVSKFSPGDELVTNYNGVRIHGRFVISATFEEDEGGEEERALVFDDALKLVDDAPAPPGMWAGRLGRDRLVTVGRERSDPRSVFVYALEV